MGYASKAEDVEISTTTSSWRDKFKKYGDSSDTKTSTTATVTVSSSVSKPPEVHKPKDSEPVIKPSPVPPQVEEKAAVITKAETEKKTETKPTIKEEPAATKVEEKPVPKWKKPAAEVTPKQESKPVEQTKPRPAE